MAEGHHRHRMRASDLPGPWVRRAECGGRTDLEPVFFPERGVPNSIAKALCGVCPVKAECLQFALDTDQAHGIWGGLSARERWRLRRRRRRVA